MGPGLTPAVALLLGAIVTPSSPVVATSIVTGRFAETHLPDRVRSTLSLECGANDGPAYLFVMLPIFLLHHAAAPLQGELALGTPLMQWLHEAVLIGVVLAVLIGAALGALAGIALRHADRSGVVGEHSLLSLGIALSLLAVTGAKLAGSDGILASFVAGIALNLTIERREEQEEENIQEAISKLFNLPIFVLFGLALPWSDWRALGLAGLAFAGLILLLRRPPVVALLWPGLRRRLGGGEILFLGWFGPIGVNTLYYAMLAKVQTGADVVWHAASLVIVASILIHGVTASPLTRRLDRAGSAR